MFSETNDDDDDGDKTTDGNLLLIFSPLAQQSIPSWLTRRTEIQPCLAQTSADISDLSCLEDPSVK